MSQLPKMYSFRELLESVPIAERTLRQVIGDLGYTRSKGCGRLLFTHDQALEIQEYIACDKVVGPREKAPPGLPIRKKGESLKAARCRETRRMLNSK